MVQSDSALRCLPCQDSEERALIVKRMLNVSRDYASELGRSALKAMTDGAYVAPSGRRIDWREKIERAKMRKLSIRPDDALPSTSRKTFTQTTIQVHNETTMQTAKSLVERGLRPLALNFADGTSAGGGFLHGGRAQEEVLCRSSALYATLEGDPMYDFHSQRDAPASTDWMILSADVPFFRSDDGTAFDQPWLLSVVSSAAPYAPRLGQPLSGDLLAQRIHRMLSVAAAYGYDVLVLGAWGCGAFGNDPVRTARDFRKALGQRFRGHFSEVVFAIADWSPERQFLAPFRDEFSASSS